LIINRGSFWILPCSFDFLLDDFLFDFVLFFEPSIGAFVGGFAQIAMAGLVSLALVPYAQTI